MRLRSGTQHRERGFTLVELVTTLILIGVLTAIAAPRFFDSPDSFSERGYTDEVASALRYAQRIAIASRCPVRVTINAANYSAMQQAACNPAGAWNAAVRRPDGRTLSGIPPQAVVLAPATTVVTFDASGNVSADAAMTVGMAFSINVDAANDTVTVLP